MRVLFDLVHPADALFFFHAFRLLQGHGVEVRIASRRKDVLTDLLDELGLEHVPVTVARSGLIGQARELVERDLALLRLARHWKPDVMAGFGGVAISHVGKLVGVPSISFYDTEHAALQIRLTLPFISEWHVPESWTGAIAGGRTFRFTGSKQYAYLHHAYFRRNTHAARNAGWDPQRENFLIRTVAWKASHDFGARGMHPMRLRQIVRKLSERGKVHISAEGELPPDLQPLRLAGKTSEFHHLLAHCRLYVGESMTVASEATALGVPALLQNEKNCAYISDQEKAGLIRRIGADDDIGAALDSMFGEDEEEFRQRAARFAAASADINTYIVDALLRHRRST